MECYESPSAIVTELKTDGILCESLNGTIVERYGYGEMYELD